MIHTIFFDLDNTLYSRNSGIWEAIGKRINLFMTEILHIPEQDVLPLRKELRTHFSTTLMGLQSLYDFDEMEFLEFVHDVDLDAMLSDDGRLRDLLGALPQRKIIFTNSDQSHAKRVLDFFNVQDFFDLIVDIIALKPFVKPQPQAYQIALDLAGYKTPDGCMFIDDMLDNIDQASQSGFFSVYVGEEKASAISIQDIFELPRILECHTKK